MPERNLLARLLCVGAVVSLGGCGLLPRMAQQTTAAVLAPFTTAAQTVNTSMQIVGRGLSSMTAETARSSRQITTAVARSPARTPVASSPQRPSTVSYQKPFAKTPRPSAKDQSSDQNKQPADEAAHDIDILPAELLKRLTPDQAALQRAAQNEALTAVIGETIFWHLDGREGTAMAESESVMGGFTCRTFVQTLALEDYFENASAIACRTDGGAWTVSF